MSYYITGLEACCPEACRPEDFRLAACCPEACCPEACCPERPTPNQQFAVGCAVSSGSKSFNFDRKLCQGIFLIIVHLDNY